MGHLWLVGMMGVGKSTAGRALARRRAVGFDDTDHAVEAAAGRSIPQLWHDLGEPGFRDLEQRVVADLAARQEPHVFAAGGGVVLREANVAAMRRSGTVAWLAAEAEDLAERVCDGEGRPLLAVGATAGYPVVEERLRALLAERSHLYEAAADVRVETGGRSVDDVIEALEGCWPVT